MALKRHYPKIGVCAAFQSGAEVVDFIIKQPYKIEFIATCDQDNSEYETTIAEACKQAHITLYRKVNANDTSFINIIKKNSIDIMFLAWWPTIITKEAIQAAKIGWVNMHPSFLPYNRGKHPYYWSIIDGSPFGVTLHFIDEHIDTGRILFQERIPIDITDTGESLYKKARKKIVKLFKKHYGNIVTLNYQIKQQDNTVASSHLGKQLDIHSQIKLNKDYNALELINIIRGRTFLHGDSAFFLYKGKKYLIKSIIEEVRD
jgi:methionyl-tRNA formyltransferase